PRGDRQAHRRPARRDAGGGAAARVRARGVPARRGARPRGAAARRRGAGERTGLIRAGSRVAIDGGPTTSDSEALCRPPWRRPRPRGSPPPPGPRPPRPWQSLSSAPRPYATAESAYRWGDRYTIDALATLGKLVVFSDPEGIRDVFGGDGDTLRAGEASGAI